MLQSIFSQQFVFTIFICWHKVCNPHIYVVIQKFKQTANFIWRLCCSQNIVKSIANLQLTSKCYRYSSTVHYCSVFDKFYKNKINELISFDCYNFLSKTLQLCLYPAEVSISIFKIVINRKIVRFWLYTIQKIFWTNAEWSHKSLI